MLLKIKSTGSTLSLLIVLIAMVNTNIVYGQQQEKNGEILTNNIDSTKGTVTLQTDDKEGFFKRLFASSASGKNGEYENIGTTLREQKRKEEQMNNLFFEAAKKSRANLMVEVLKQGADINTKNQHGRTALIEAARTGDHQIAKILIDMGASINVKDNYDATALAYANRNRTPGNTEIVLLLLKNNAVK